MLRDIHNAERNQKYTEQCMTDIAEYSKDPEMKFFKHCQAIMFNAPTVVYITIPKKRTQYCLFDSGAIEMSIMLSAKAHGIDSVPAYESIKYPDILRKYMKISDDEDIVIGIALGYEDKENILSKIKTKKLTLDEACHFYE